MSERGPQDQPDEAMVDLLIKQVTDGLSPAEQRALDVLDSAVVSAHLRDFERAAAAIALVGSANAPALPPDLAQRVARQAEQHFGAVAGADKPIELAAARSAAAARAPAAAPRSQAYGWLAAAACLVLAVVAWNRPPQQAPTAQVSPQPAAVPPETVRPPTVPPAPPTPAEERAALLAKADSLKVTFGATKDPAAHGVSGDVVWDPATQRGFMRLAGLAPNDPSMHQYQLWIFDGGRDKRYPVDGGVFDIPANATEVVLPIRAALPVVSPKAFAVTIEKPGGVVVSGREHVVALGAAG
ncbi:MAG TPA: anti-sigma factor [Steroidobacteraceae bacterium]|nr:anti-sigma factor [Steroidobacteraceae bacterium]